MREAAELGFSASEKGQMIKPANYTAIEQQITAGLVDWWSKKP
jgi:hypothetical protein